MLACLFLAVALVLILFCMCCLCVCVGGAGCGLRVAGCGLRVAGCGLREDQQAASALAGEEVHVTVVSAMGVTAIMPTPARVQGMH